MKELHVLVFGRDSEKQLVTHESKILHVKKSNWLYSGVIERPGIGCEEFILEIFSNAKLLPDAIIDNGKWFDRKSFGSQPRWEDNLKTLIRLSWGLPINCYTGKSAE